MLLNTRHKSRLGYWIGIFFFWVCSWQMSRLYLPFIPVSLEPWMLCPKAMPLVGISCCPCSPGGSTSGLLSVDTAEPKMRLWVVPGLSESSVRNGMSPCHHHWCLSLRRSSVSCRAGAVQSLWELHCSSCCLLQNDYSSWEWLIINWIFIIYWIVTSLSSAQPFSKSRVKFNHDNLLGVGDAWPRGMWSWVSLHPCVAARCCNNSFYPTFSSKYAMQERRALLADFLLDSFITETTFPTYRPCRSPNSWWLC